MSADRSEISHRLFHRYEDAYDEMVDQYDKLYDDCNIDEDEEFRDLSSISKDYAIIEDHGINTYVWKISEILQIE